MGYVKYIPLGKTPYADLSTTTRPEIQLWQELVMLRHLRHPKGVFAKIVSAPWIDQAKIYFLDACGSDWRTAGLLYYYSFLNLAKAYLASKRVFPARILKSTSVYHGLSADPQSPAKIIDFEIKIHPPMHNGKRNLFSTLCERITNSRWPHQSTITIRVSDVLTYCSDISAELEKFYNINKSIIIVQSLLRSDQRNLWCEVVVPNYSLPVIQSHMPKRGLITVGFKGMNNLDFSDWLSAYDRPRPSFSRTSMIRTTPRPIVPGSTRNGFIDVISDAEHYFTKYALAFPSPHTANNQCWQFIPNITLSGKTQLWHPLLSDYLFAFVLSTILRYHPHLLPNDTEASFTAEAWCNQSAITVLRYFLMKCTSPSIRMACE